MIEQLASYQRGIERIGDSWSEFRARRLDRLRERERFGHAAERATESIIEDLFTLVLDWGIGDLNHQVGYADILLSRLGIKYLIVEAKRPGALAWDRPAVEAALDQASRYAAEQKVRCVAVTDGTMLYGADVVNGGLRDRVFCALDGAEPPHSLWWLSVDGIYRDRDETADAALALSSKGPPSAQQTTAQTDAELLHPKYKLPARCFAYVGNASDTRSWHLPYRTADGSVDGRRLPKAVQSILSNYRGAHLSSVPESAIPDVLVRLANAAGSLGKLPDQSSDPAAVYVRLQESLVQLDRIDDVSHG